MTKQTKYEVLLEFIDDLNDVVNKINSNTANNGDYIKLKEYFLMVSIKESTVDGIYSDCGFDSFADFRKQRQLSKNEQVGNISCTLSKINGLHEAVVEFLQYKISEDMKRS